MKTATRLQISTLGRTIRLVLLVTVMAALAVAVVAVFPRAEQAPPDTERTTHYNFPTYA